MSDETATANRATRRVHRAKQSVKEQQLALQMMRVYDGGGVPRRDGESDPDYFRRVREKAIRIQRHERAARRKAERAARKRNR